MSETLPEPATEAGAAQAEPRRRPGTFAKGDPRINRKGKIDGTIAPLLRDMRAVYRQQKGKDRGDGQKLCRKLLEESPARFLAQLNSLEKAHAGSRKAKEPSVEKRAPTPTSAPETAADEGAERCLGLIEQMLREKPWLTSA